MNEELLEILRRVDTPTVCNAIEVAEGRRGFSAFTRGTMLSSDPSAGPIVGYARTAKIAARAPSDEDPVIVRQRRMDYYRYMAEARDPGVAVIEDVDFPECIGAYWGEINTTVHRGFGLKGALTNGVMRDLGDLPEGFPVIAGSVGPSHGFVHVREYGTPVSIFGLTVEEGDLIHADRHGALTIPPDIIHSLAEAIHNLLQTEQLVLGPARETGFDFERFVKAWERFEAART